MNMTPTPSASLVISYIGEDHYHREHAERPSRPACDPGRRIAAPALRTQAENRGNTPCPECWPNE